MGLTLRCEKTGRAADFTMSGFMRLRMVVADLCGEEVSAHYRLLLDSLYARFDSPEEKATFWEAYNVRTEKMILCRRLDSRIADFLYLPDAGGRISYRACKKLLKVIGTYDGNGDYGYLWSNTRFRDFRRILEVCVHTKSAMEWY